MILCIADILTAEERAAATAALADAPFVDGAATAGWNARGVKRNEQLAAGPALRQLQAMVAAAIERSVLFALACRPQTIRPALFNRHAPGMEYGAHVDDPLMGAKPAMRSDISVSLFLSDPATYDGGELVVEATAGEQAFKLDPGCLVLYPASTLHRVAPVTRGLRLAAITWVQSQVRDPARRELLFELDTARRALFERDGKSREFDLVSKSLVNLLRMWAEP